MSHPVIELKDIRKIYGDHVIFQKFSLKVNENSFLILHGPSGCGKSTLLNMLGLLEKSDGGEITWFGHKNIKPFSSAAEKMLREKIGYLFQSFALVDQATVAYNLKLAMAMTNMTNQADRIKEALHQVGLDGYEKKRICQCSGGEQQRIAIARLILKPCELILADEPTGSLDEENKVMIFELLKFMQSMGKTIIVVTHDKEMFHYGDETIDISTLDKYSQE